MSSYSDSDSEIDATIDLDSIVPTYWYNEGGHQAEYAVLQDLIPNWGETTFPVEYVRIFGRFYHDLFNNGWWNVTEGGTHYIEMARRALSHAELQEDGLPVDARNWLRDYINLSRMSFLAERGWQALAESLDAVLDQVVAFVYSAISGNDYIQNVARNQDNRVREIPPRNQDNRDREIPSRNDDTFFTEFCSFTNRTESQRKVKALREILIRIHRHDPEFLKLTTTEVNNLPLWGHRSLCRLLMRKQTEQMTHCTRNAVEPFTQEPVQNIPLIFLWNHHGYCFDIMQLQRWIQNYPRGRPSNPMNRIPFTDEEIEQIKRRSLYLTTLLDQVFSD